jgi:hypothetical protein
MPVKYFAPKVTETVSLIFPPRDNRGQKNERSECCSAHSYLYHGPGLRSKI